MNWILYFLVLLKAILFSTGGMGPLPSLHNDFLLQGWATEKEFTEALSIGQITPGPNGLWVISLCYLVAGLRGALIACVALLLPPLLILVVKHYYTKIANHPATHGLLDGVVLVIVAFNVIVLTRVFISNGADAVLVAIAVISAVLAISRRVPANMILLAALLIGVIFR